MKMTVLILLNVFVSVPLVAGADWTINPDKGLTEFQEDVPLQFLQEPSDATFKRAPNTFSWISDIEHIIEPKAGEILLADASPAYCLCGAVVPGGTSFELFPYHYYGKDEEKKLGGKIKYKLVAVNQTDKDIDVEITGIGTTTTWDHSRTWAAALAGEGAKKITIKPGETYTFLEEKELKGDFPWSAIVLGKATGDLLVSDYAWLGENDPGFLQSRQTPDLGLKPYEAPSFTRGTAPWNAATVTYFPKKRDKDGNLQLSKMDDKLNSVAFASAPGGPVTNLWAYHLYDQTFKEDEFDVVDPVSKKSHLFFGGNYPVMYGFPLSVVNDTEQPKTVNVYLCSNDFCCVHTLVGIWAQNQFHNRLVPVVGWDQHWRVATTILQPGERDELDLTVVPLGSRWAGLIATLEVTAPGKEQYRLDTKAPALPLEQRTSRYGWTTNRYWLKNANRFINENKTEKQGGIVFLGDSLTERFPLKKRFEDINVINRGIAGDRIEGLTARLDISAYNLKPGKIILNIGVNDLLFPQADLKDLTRRYGLLLNKLKKNCPDVPVVMQTILPTTGKFARCNPQIVELNKNIRRLAFEHKYELLDLHPYFVNEKGELKAEYTDDGVHLTPAGYDIWVELLKPYVKTK